MLEPLNREYWPDDMRHPYIRLALALLFGPLIVVILVGPVLWAAWTAVNPDGADIALLRELISGAFFALYVITLAALPVILLLWSARVRVWWVFAVAGFALWFAAAALHAFTLDAPFSLPSMTIVALIGAIHLVTIRALAGIRVGT